jgi:phage shock protein A
MNPDDAVKEFLGDRPNAEELTEWRATLEDRLKRLEAERDKGGTPTPGLQQKIAQLKKQVAALRQEEAITQFVEDSVRVTLAMGSTTDAGEFDGSEIEE